MHEGTTTIRCPHCGHPYPMTRLQLDVYIGRSMGCMRCGRSFAVSVPAPAPVDDLFGADVTQGLPPSGNPVMFGSPTTPASFTASPPAGGSALMLGRIGMAAAVLFVALAAVAAAVGYASSSDDAISLASRSRWPMTLLQVGYGVAAVGALAGFAGVVQVYRKRRQDNSSIRYGLARAAVIVCLSELTLASLLVLMVMPPLNRGLAEAHRATCQTNLQTVGYALIAAASERPDGRFPLSLMDLVSQKRVPADKLVCPADSHAVAPYDGPTAEQAAGDRHLSYVYLANGLSMKAAGGRQVTTHTVLAYEQPGLHNDPEAFHVLFADGAVVFVDKGRAAELLQELKAGQNPPPAAAAIKP